MKAGRCLLFAISGMCVMLAAPAPAASQDDTGRPALPRLVLDDLPPPVRASLARAYEDARKRPGDASAVGHMAMVLHAYEQYRLASSYYHIARQLDPRSLAWAYLHGVVGAELGEHPHAASSFRRALGIDPTYLPARLRLADALMESGDLDASGAEYDALARSLPELALAHFGLGRVWAIRGDAEAAARHYQRAVGVAPQFGRAHYALALAYRDAGLADRAQLHLQAHRESGATQPSLPDRLMDQLKSLRSTARDLIAEGAKLGDAGRFAESIAVHLKALEADPTAAQAHVNLISLYGRRGSPREAEAHYRAALTLGSSLAEAHYNYGVLLAALGRYAEASAAFHQALGVDPFHGLAHNNIAALLAQDGKREEAAAHYRQALASDPQHLGARFGLGRVLVALGQPREAVEHLKKILRPEGPDTPRYQYALANAWFAAGESATAREHAAAALQHAKRLGQAELAERIEQGLQRMMPGRR